MKDVYILGIESSCDETSVSIVKNGNEEIVTKTLSQIDIHKKFGGVVPEIASRSHAECITIVIDEAITESKLSWDDIDAIAVTNSSAITVSPSFADAVSALFPHPANDIAINKDNEIATILFLFIKNTPPKHYISPQGVIISPNLLFTMKKLS